MPTPQELEAKFWDNLKSDMTVMLGLAGVEEGHTRPMTAQFDGDADHGPIYFFTSNETDLVKALSEDSRALISFSSKGHELFASVHGTLSLYNDRGTIDRLWNKYVAAWFEGGKSDPKLALLKFEPERAEIWENASSLLAGIKLMLGIDPKKSYRDKAAEVRLN